MGPTEIATRPVQSLSSSKFYEQCSQSVSSVDAGSDQGLPKSATSSNSGPQRALRSEALRLATFQGWPLQFLHPRDLSAAGFFYRGLGDQVQCAFCSIQISQWEMGDNPMTEHRKHAPNCAFVLQLPVGNIPLTSSRSSPAVPTVSSSSRPSFMCTNFGSSGIDTCSRFQHEVRPNALPERVPATTLTIRPTNNGGEPSTSGDISSLNLVRHQQARQPELSSFEARMKTFVDWPAGLKQRPSQLAEAGLYYLKTGDHVKCFCCDGALHNWEPNDDPWVEHARWFSRCNFLISVKGKEYIEEIQRQYQQKPTEASATSDNVVQTEKTEKEEVKAVATVSTSAEASSGEKLRDALLCQICCDQPLSMVFLPCGHSMCCPSCATALTNCPLCRKRIEATVRAYFPFP